MKGMILVLVKKRVDMFINLNIFFTIENNS